MTLEQAAEVYAATFAARTDAYNGWLGDHWGCVREPLTADVVLRGIRDQQPVGAYLITPANATHVAAIDFDADDGWALAVALRAAMMDRGVLQVYIEPSRRGAHLWCVLDEVLAARTVRRALRGFLAAALIPEGPKVEIRPIGDEIKPDGFGSPLRMPTMPHPKTGQRYPLCGPYLRPLGNLESMMRDVCLADADAFRDMASRTPPSRSELGSDYFPPRPQYRDEGGSVSEILLTLWGVPRAVPGREIRCPAHDDQSPSLSILHDDQRVLCHSVGCLLNNDGHGRGINELRRLAPHR